MNDPWEQFKQAETQARQEYEAKVQARDKEHEARYQAHKQAILALWVDHVKEHGAHTCMARYKYGTNVFDGAERLARELLAHGYTCWYRHGQEEDAPGDTGSYLEYKIQITPAPEPERIVFRAY